MNTQRFKNLIGSVHEIWASKALNTPLNTMGRGGIDLLDGYKGIEVKSCMIKPNDPDPKRHYVKWTMFGYQLSWGDKKYNDMPLFFALCTYELSHNVSRLWTQDPKRLESHVKNREIWVVPWNWSTQFPPKVGKCHTYKYLRPNPRADLGIAPIPEVIDKVERKKGTIYFTEGANISMFS
ncbi:hypothetical protein HN747_01350 [archaeon]|jgi:hypothetical protein|nr:hypothetical protein [archaeon]